MENAVAPDRLCYGCYGRAYKVPLPKGNLLSLGEVARRLGVGLETARGYVRSGRLLPAVFAHGRWHIAEGALQYHDPHQAWREARRVYTCDGCGTDFVERKSKRPKRRHYCTVECFRKNFRPDETSAALLSHRPRKKPASMRSRRKQGA